jgi:L-iditol 2-dehydrogenase
LKAVVCYGNNDVRWEDVPDVFPKEDEVKIKVKACGICGSDIPRATKTGAHSYPIILGHEFSGVVEKVGKNVKGINVGEKVTAAPLVPCYECEQCKKGNFSLCPNYSFIGSRQQGAMAESVCVPAKNIVKLSENTTFEQGALFEPATVSLHAFGINQYEPNGYVAILGGGTIGIFAMQWAKILGCKKVVVFGRDKEHLQLSKELGADEVISTLDEKFIEQAMNLTDGRGFDYIFESAGAVATIKYSFKLAAKKARICLIGTPTNDISFTPREWDLINRKEFILTGSWMSYSNPFPGKEWEMTKKCFANGCLKFDDRLFYKKFDMGNAKNAFALFMNPKEKIKGRILLTSNY